MLNQALSKQREERAYLLYSTVYPNMTKETFIPFEKFYMPQKKEVVEEKTTDEILQEVKEILNSHSWR